MRIKSTCFIGFRNLAPDRAEWSPGLNMITGANGAGKTNFLEGVSMASGWGPSESTTKVMDTVKWGESTAALFLAASGEEDAEVSMTLAPRCGHRIGERPTSAAELRARVPLMPFFAGHISIIKGPPASRRGLLDRVGSVISRMYCERLRDCRRLVRQKSAMLRRGASTRPADMALGPVACWIWRAREEIVAMISRELESLGDLTPYETEIRFERGGAGSCERPADDFRASIASHADRERASCAALVGPHRDDIEIVAGGRPALALSRGESRRTASALIIAAARAVERSLSRGPILLFDEMFSELDSYGSGVTIDALMSTGYQVFAASAESAPIPGAAMYRIDGGRIADV